VPAGVDDGGIDAFRDTGGQGGGYDVSRVSEFSSGVDGGGDVDEDAGAAFCC